MNHLKSRLSFLAFPLLFVLAAFAPLYGQSRIAGSQNWYVTGYVLTTSPVSVASLVSSGSMTASPPTASQIVWLCGSDINALAGTAASVTMKDGNGGAYFPAITPLSSTAPSMYNFPLGTSPFNGAAFGGCRPFPGGLMVSANTASAITWAGWGVF
jgi:hypothetical protein